MYERADIVRAPHNNNHQHCGLLFGPHTRSPVHVWYFAFSSLKIVSIYISLYAFSLVSFRIVCVVVVLPFSPCTYIFQNISDFFLNFKQKLFHWHLSGPKPLPQRKKRTHTFCRCVGGWVTGSPYPCSSGSRR